MLTVLLGENVSLLSANLLVTITKFSQYTTDCHQEECYTAPPHPCGIVCLLCDINPPTLTLIQVSLISSLMNPIILLYSRVFQLFKCLFTVDFVISFLDIKETCFPSIFSFSRYLTSLLCVILSKFAEYVFQGYWSVVPNIFMGFSLFPGFCYFSLFPDTIIHVQQVLQYLWW